MAGDTIVVTGSSGFIGSHVCHLLTAAGRRDVVGLDLQAESDARALRADVRCADHLRQIAAHLDPRTVIHLAAMAEVVIPFGELGELARTNVNGTINVLEALRPTRVVLASSSAVYGTSARGGARARWRDINPLGAYGVSKVAAEIACRDWAAETGGSAVSLRFGNVIGKGCRGLIPYLVEHALRHPDGRQPAELRGDGSLLRDYVPIGHVTQAIMRAADLRVPPGRSIAFNVGSGRGLSNRAVATTVQRAVRRVGLNLTCDFNLPPAPGESLRLILDTTSTTRRLGLLPPTADEVIEAIEDAVRHCIAVAE
jgi:UDP-arabinose 4-epimerase